MSDPIEILTGEDGSVIVNDSGLPARQVIGAIRSQASTEAASLFRDPTYDAIVKWTSDTKSGFYKRRGGLLDRDKYVSPENFFDKMRVCYEASRDDIVAAFLDSSEALAFSRINVECDDPDEEDIWQQICENIDLDNRMREIWRELNIVSQAYVAVWFGKRDFKVRGKTEDGTKRKRAFRDLTVPLGITVLDPFKVIPVGNFLFNQEILTYYADPTEKDVIDSWLLGDDASGADPIIQQLIIAKYEPDFRDRKEIGNLGVDPNRLYILNPKYVWRHTTTRPGYERFAPLRMESCFELLDLKHQLRAMDRASLIGAPLRVDQRVMTPSGWKPIGEVVVGDQVYGPDGLPTDVVGVFPQGTLDLYKVRFSDGAEVVCNDTHLWTVRTPWVDRWRTIPLRQIMEEGLRSGKTYRHRIPMHAAVQLPCAEHFLDPYLIGTMLGDGSFANTTPKITSAEIDDFPWAKVLPEGVTVSRYEGSTCPTYGIRGERWHQNVVTDELKRLGLWGAVDHNKFIPPEYMAGSVAQRWALLQGLLDTDGSNGVAGVVEHYTVSKRLASDLVELAQSLGCAARTSLRFDRRDDYERRVGHRTTISFPPASDPPFRLGRKAHQWRNRKYPFVRAVVDVQKVNPAEAVCIKVNREDGLFLTEGYVATHNSNFILLIKKGSDHDPAKPYEITALQDQVRSISKVPVIVGDHRLNIEIITPKTDQTLDSDRYLGLDIRISGRLYGMFITTHAGRDDSLKLARVVARALESRRSMQSTSFMKNVFWPTFELNDALRDEPRMVFHPKSISLDFDPSRATYLLDLRDRGDLSRKSILSEIDYDEAEEAKTVKMEIEKYNAIFQPGQDPKTGLPIEQDAGLKKVPAESLNYKDAPPDIKRQIEKQAGLKPSTLDPAQLPIPAGGTKAPVVKAAPAKKAAVKPGAPNDPKRAGRAGGGNHNHGGNGNIGRGGGEAARPRTNPRAPTVAYPGTQKGIIGQPKGPGTSRKSPAAQQKKADSGG